ncbi:MAG: hypothetical protein LBE47_01120, partial [Methanomassiliicoccaceae archaeon]|nr:hypothetical protein [Methanomassiliicoccaceae archaeon]
MRKNTIKYLSLIVVSILFTAPFAIMAAASANGDNEQHRDVSLNDRGGAFDDTWIPVSTPQELAWVGDNNTRTASNGISYTWSADGKYYLANDIAFDDGPGHDTNGGSDMTVSATASGTDINITVTPPSGAAVTYLSAWIGASDNTSLNNTVQLTDVPGGTHIVMIGGTMTLDTVKHNFAHSFEMDTTSGTSMNDIKFNS